jgi:putative phosphoesterase
VKLGLISDVHGDRDALERALGHLAGLGADRIICAGDLVGYGPDPDAVVGLLAGRGISCVRGNHDRWALSRDPGSPDEFGGSAPSPETREFLKDLPPDLVLADGQTVAVVVHGSPRGDMDFVLPRTHPPAVLCGYLRTLGANLLVVGHTHTPMWYRCERGLVVNPGSLISIPVVKSSKTFAMVDLDDLTVTFHKVETGEEFELAPWDGDSAGGRPR